MAERAGSLRTSGDPNVNKLRSRTVVTPGKVSPPSPGTGRHPGLEPERADVSPMTHTALVGRQIAVLRQASGVTIVVRLGDPDPQQPKQKAPLNLMTLQETLRRFSIPMCGFSSVLVAR